MIVVPVLRSVNVESLGPRVAPVIWRFVVTGVSATAAGDAGGAGEGETAGEATGDGDGATAGDATAAGAGDGPVGLGVGAGAVVGAAGAGVHPAAPVQTTRLAASSSAETIRMLDPKAQAMPRWSRACPIPGRSTCIATPDS